MAHVPARRSGNRGSDPSVKYLGYLSLAALVACFIARAPTTLDKTKVPIIDLELNLNAGYVVIFGPLLIACAIAVIVYLRRSDRRKVTLAYVVVRAIPCLAAAFLSLQFFLLLASKGQCPTFSRWQYLTDSTLSAFQPEYCMGLPADTQQHIPWLLSPVIAEAWAQVLLPLIAIAIVVIDWQASRGRSR